MATRETRALRGRRRGRALVARTIGELRDHRVTANLSLSAVARELGMSAPNLWRIEANQVEAMTVLRLCEMASVLGYEVSLGLHPIGDPIRDKGQQACARRFDKILSDAWRLTNETLLPGAGEQRAWDKLLRLIGETPPYLVGVDIESRVWDMQAIVRRTRARERDGHVDHILLVLADTAHNRRVIDQLREALGPAYVSSPRSIMAALRRGEKLPGSGVILI